MSCDHLPAPPPPFHLRLPGAAELVGFDLGALAQPALAPLAPFFRLLDVVIKAVDVVRALPDALTLPPDPTAIAQRLPALLEAAGHLAPLAPAVAVPVTAISLLDAAIQELQQTRARLEALDLQRQRIARARARAVELADGPLAEAARCAEDNLSIAARGLVAPLAAVRGLLHLLGLLLAAAGAPPLPPWSLPASGDPEVLLADLTALEHTLAAARERLSPP